MSRPPRISGHTDVIKCGCGKLYVVMNVHETGYKEVFLFMGKAGGCAMSHCDSLGRLITKGLNCGMPKAEVVRALKGVQCPTPYMGILSCSDAVAKVLEEWDDSLTTLKFNMVSGDSVKNEKEEK